MCIVCHELIRRNVLCDAQYAPKHVVTEYVNLMMTSVKSIYHNEALVTGSWRIAAQAEYNTGPK